jgi:hypothetical protein
MGLSFKGTMDFLLSTILFFKGKNFTILKEFSMGGVHVKEYRYNMRRFLTDVWPPKLSEGKGLPIRTAVREDDGSDVTEMVLRFSGPRKNYVNPVSVFRKKKKFRIDVQEFGKIRFVLEDTWIPYDGNVIVTDVMGFKKVIPVQYKKYNGEAHLSP